MGCDGLEPSLSRGSHTRGSGPTPSRGQRRAVGCDVRRSLLRAPRSRIRPAPAPADVSAESHRSEAERTLLELTQRARLGLALGTIGLVAVARQIGAVPDD